MPLNLRSEYTRALWLIGASLNIIWWAAVTLRAHAPLSGSLGAERGIDLMCHGLSAARELKTPSRHAPVTRLWWSCHARSLGASMTQLGALRSGRSSPLGAEWEPVIAVADLSVIDLTGESSSVEDTLRVQLTLYALPTLSRVERSPSAAPILPELWDSYGVASSQGAEPNHWIFAHRLSHEGEITILTPREVSPSNTVRDEVSWSTVYPLTALPSHERLLALHADKEGWEVWSREVPLERGQRVPTTSGLIRRAGVWPAHDTHSLGAESISEVKRTRFAAPRVVSAGSATPRSARALGVTRARDEVQVVWRVGDRLTIGQVDALGPTALISSELSAALSSATDLELESPLARGGARPWLIQSVSPWRWREVSAAGEMRGFIDSYPHPYDCVQRGLKKHSALVQVAESQAELEAWGIVSAQTRPHLVALRGAVGWEFAPLSEARLGPDSGPNDPNVSACVWRPDQHRWTPHNGQRGVERWIPLSTSPSGSKDFNISDDSDDSDDSNEREARRVAMWINDQGAYRVTLGAPALLERLRVGVARRALELSAQAGGDVRVWRSALTLSVWWALSGCGVWSVLIALRTLSKRRGTNRDKPHEASTLGSLTLALITLSLMVLSWIALIV